MSDYKKGDWCDVWDGLFWRFVGKNATFLSKNYRMNMMVKTYEKMDAGKKARLNRIATDFIKTKTSGP
jgi:deoxyribodipyrimidine photolyase-related protein